MNRFIALTANVLAIIITFHVQAAEPASSKLPERLGGFAGPYVIGALKESTGSYAASMAMLAAVLTFSAAIVLALGRAMAPRPAIIAPKARGAA